KTLQDNVQTLKNTIGHRGITAIFTEKTEREKKLDKSSKLLSDLQTTIRTYRGMVNDYDAMIKSFEKKFVDTQWKGHRELGLNGKDDGGYSERKAAKEAKIARLKEQEEFDIKAKYRKELEPEIRAEMTRAERRGSSYSLSSGDAASEWFTEQTQGRKAEIAQRIVEKQRVIAETASGSYSL
ncbi:MAG TPA: hypothetical protein VJK48_03265, partial [Chlamydiales bacterium]|nr:hypothetical protein [Chlamydiales bacterium]